MYLETKLPDVSKPIVSPQEAWRKALLNAHARGYIPPHPATPADTRPDSVIAAEYGVVRQTISEIQAGSSRAALTAAAQS